MGSLYRHRSCLSLIAAYSGRGVPALNSRDWLIRTPAGRMVRPAPCSDDKAYCPDCALPVPVTPYTLEPFLT